MRLKLLSQSQEHDVAILVCYDVLFMFVYEVYIFAVRDFSFHVLVLSVMCACTNAFKFLRVFLQGI